MADLMNTISVNVLGYLAGLTSEFSLTTESVLPCITRTMAELNKSVGDIDQLVALDSEAQFYIECRAEYWLLHQIKNGEVTDFKYNTGETGRAVDKTKIPENINGVMTQLNNLWRRYFVTFSKTNQVSQNGGIYTRKARTYTDLGD